MLKNSKGKNIKRYYVNIFVWQLRQYICKEEYAAYELSKKNWFYNIKNISPQL